MQFQNLVEGASLEKKKEKSTGNESWTSNSIPQHRSVDMMKCGIIGVEFELPAWGGGSPDPKSQNRVKISLFWSTIRTYRPEMFSDLEIICDLWCLLFPAKLPKF